MDTTGVNDRERAEEGQRASLQQRGHEARELAREVADDVRERVRSGASGPVASDLEHTAKKVSRTAAEKMHRAASAIRERSNGNETKMTRFADTAASKIDNAASYVESATISGLRQDIGGVIQRYPLQSIAAGVGFGFIASRLLRRR